MSPYQPVRATAGPRAPSGGISFSYQAGRAGLFPRTSLFQRLAPDGPPGRRGRQHRQGDVPAVPAIPFPDFILVQTHLSLGLLKAFFDGPTSSGGGPAPDSSRVVSTGPKSDVMQRQLPGLGDAAIENQQPVLPLARLLQGPDLHPADRESYLPGVPWRRRPRCAAPRLGFLHPSAPAGPSPHLSPSLMLKPSLPIRLLVAPDGQHVGMTSRRSSHDRRLRSLP